ncbi:glucan endo-1,3-beta-glucosidase-like [Elaeis guineensis]|uniref:glucan endo-1,3-beta-glucosidase-like n=1 Tax=Elaeis guineensis var. tenera TaxID=51953 RepID=UPI003C6D2E1C
MNGDNLPSPADAVALYKKNNIKKMRLFEPRAEVLSALQLSDIFVSLGVRNEDIPNLATSPDAAWHVAPAMKNLRDALDSIGYVGVKVTTVVANMVLGTSFLPSQATYILF